ncbi:MAG: nitroreductase family protein [Methanothrix sp.]|jgi:nitroreductase|nr:nitroreductase family protein [Methanothrix sp.]
MELMQAIRARRSIRNYLDRPVEEEKLLAVLEAGRLAPSARNMQDWRFIVVSDPATRQRLAEAARDQQFVAQAPLVIAACGTSDLVMTCGQPAYAIDVAIALDHMTLAAASLGLGSCWIGAFYEDRVKQILAVPPEVRVVALLPLGYPADMPAPRPRKSLEDIAAREHW